MTSPRDLSVGDTSGRSASEYSINETFSYFEYPTATSGDSSSTSSSCPSSVLLNDLAKLKPQVNIRKNSLVHSSLATSFIHSKNDIKQEKAKEIENNINMMDQSSSSSWYRKKLDLMKFSIVSEKLIVPEGKVSSSPLILWNGNDHHNNRSLRANSFAFDLIQSHFPNVSQTTPNSHLFLLPVCLFFLFLFYYNYYFYFNQSDNFYLIFIYFAPKI